MSETKAKILVVDDSEDNRLMLSAMLRHRYDIHTIDSGEKCLEMAANEQPDLILLDVMMPKLSGDDVCYNLKIQSETKSIPVVLVTAMTEQDYEVRYGRVLADGFVKKPVKRAGLCETIDRLLN